MRLSFEGTIRLDSEELYVFDSSMGIFDSAFKNCYREWFPNAKHAERWVGFRVETPLVERDRLVFYNRSESEQWVFYVFATIGDDEVWVENPKYKWIKVAEIEL